MIHWSNDYDSINKIDEIKPHIDITKNLKNLKNITNILFHGPSGSGKLTIVFNLLKYLLNIEKFKLNKILIPIKNSNKLLEIYQNNYFYYIDLLHLEPKLESFLFNDFINNIVKSKNILNKQHIFVINNLTLENNNALIYLKKFLSKFICNVNFIIISKTKFNNKLFSHLMCIRIPKIKTKNLKLVLKDILKRKDIKKKITKKTLKNIIELSNNHLTNSINLLQLKITNNYEFKQYINLENKYYNKIFKILSNKKNQPIENINYIREFIYEYFNNINKTNLIKDVMDYLIKKNLNEKILFKIINISSKIEENIKNINKEIIAYEYYLLEINKLLITI